MKQWYEELFENYGLKYDNESFTRGTAGECDFIEKEVRYNKAINILDIGCGTGRHAIELARRGYSVVGIDLSESQLRRAREKAAEQKLKVDFRKHDARKIPFNSEFDLAIMLCGGSFPLMETDEMNYKILKNAAKALKPGGKLILTTMNGLFPLFNRLDEFHNVNTNEGNEPYRNGTFDLMTFRDINTTVFEDDSGNKKELTCNERYYVPSEISWLLKTLKFKNIGIYGARLGAFSRDDTLTTGDFEMLVIAER